jgi:hypothetical protein
MGKRLVAVAVIALLVCSAAAQDKKPTVASVPKNACDLVTLEQVQVLLPDVTDGEPAPLTGVGHVKGATCRWELTMTSALGEEVATDSLTVEVGTLPPGTPMKVLKSSLLSQIGGSNQGNGEKVSGLGTAAIVLSTVPTEADVKAIVGKLSLAVRYNTGGAGISSLEDADTRQDDVVTLAKAIAAKI